MAGQDAEAGDGRAGPPGWLDEGFMSRALQHAGEDAHVDKIEIQYAVPAGNNYCSSIFRVATHVRGESAPRSLLVKLPPEGEVFSKMIDDGGYFQKEILMFTEIVPTISRLLRELTPVGELQPLIARCFHHGDKPVRFLVLQDLKEKNFYLGNRLKGLNLNKASLVLETLGSFHAATHVLLKTNPEMFEIMDNPFESAGMFTEKDFDDSISTVAKSVGEWSQLYEKKLLSLLGRTYVQNQLVNRPRPGKFNVLVHGDLWVNNIMLRDNDEGKTVDIRFLDLQLCHVTNPAIDLILFLYTSLEDDVYSNNWDELLNVYVNSLSVSLERLGENAITLEQIKEYLEEAREYIFLASLMWLPLIRLEKGSFDVEKVLNEGASTQSDTYRTPEFTHWMKKLLPEFDRRGMFDPQ